MITSISVAGFLVACGAYIIAHLSPATVHSDLGAIIIGVIGVITGVLTHNTRGTTAP